MQETDERMICGYQVIGSLGRGATSEVLLVQEKDTGQVYALKKSENREVIAAEAAVLSRLKCDVFPYFKECIPEENCLVMEYIEGKSLQELLINGKEFEVGEIMYIMQAILRGLTLLHEQRMVYRDLKPTNIMIERSGRVRLIDLGGVTCLGLQASDKIIHAGTYGYAAPEQFWPGVEAEPACDVYAAGKLLLYLFTGKDPAKPPYHMEEEYKENIRIPASFREVLDRCLAMNPQARYEDAKVLWTALQRAYEQPRKKWILSFQRSTGYVYEKSIWKSEYHE